MQIIDIVTLELAEIHKNVIKIKYINRIIGLKRIAVNCCSPDLKKNDHSCQHYVNMTNF